MEVEQSSELASDRDSMAVGMRRSKTMSVPVRPRRVPRILEQQELDGFRAGDPKAADDVREKCTRYVNRRFSTGLRKEDVEDVVSGALSDTWPAINSGRSLHGVNQVIVTSLERWRKRFKRAKAKARDWEVELPEPTAEDVQWDFTRRLDAENLIDWLVGIIDPTMEKALNRLSDRDRFLLAQEYGLPFAVSAPGSLPTSQEAKKKALQRARKRFNEQLEEILEEDERTGALPSDVAKVALRVVRGGKIEDVLAYMEETLQ